MRRPLRTSRGLKVEKRMSEIGLQREEEAEYLKKKKAASCPRGDLIYDIIEWAKGVESVAVLQAPFEADAHVVYVETSGFADFVVALTRTCSYTALRTWL